MNTFEKHFRRFPDLLDDIGSWDPHFIVPVAKKGAKLLRLVEDGAQKFKQESVRYRQFFVLNRINLDGKRVAILDDATQYTATLSEYRSFFERQGAQVRTYSLVGHQGLADGTHWQYDKDAVVVSTLPDPVYQEYIVQESRHLLAKGNHFDLDHLVFEIGCLPSEVQDLKTQLANLGHIADLSDHYLPSHLQRFVLDDVRPFRSLPYLDHRSVLSPPFTKIKFVYDSDRKTLSLAPMVFPSWHYRGAQLLPEHFAAVPFALPYRLEVLADEYDQRSLLRYYHSIYLVHAVSLVKVLSQTIGGKFTMPGALRLRQRDLRATYGDKAVDKMAPSIEEFVSSELPIDFSSDRQMAPRQRGKKINLPNMGALIGHLRSRYEEAVERRQTRIGVHYALPYDSLVSTYGDRGNLAIDLDYFCDLGVLVPDVIRSNGYIRRGVRSGELNGQYDWARTELLVPIAIDQLTQSLGGAQGQIEATALVKSLANFAFDYPPELNGELHNFFTEPYLYGAYVRVYHPLRAFSRPSLYETEKVSPYYHYNKAKAHFEIRQKQRLAQEVRRFFDDRLEVPYSEVASYFRILGRIMKHFRGTDVLNMLSICRDEDYFYRHVHFNVCLSVEASGQVVSARTPQVARAALDRVESQVESAATKLRLFGLRDEYRSKIEQRFASDLEAIGTLTMLRRHWRDSSSNFGATLAEVASALDLQRVFCAVYRHVLDRSAKAWSALSRAENDGLCERWDVPSPREAAQGEWSDPKCLAFGEKCLGAMSQVVSALDAPSKGLDSRLRMEAEHRARNIAMGYVGRTGTKHIALLYIDFTGFRLLPEPKSAIIGSYYLLVESSIKARGGEVLYGGKGGDDAFTIAFGDPESAVQCARDIKAQFAADLFLGTTFDVKFGLAGASESPLIGETTIVRCWGRAKDACELKTPSFRNVGDLIVDDETHRWMSRRPSRNRLRWVTLDPLAPGYWRSDAVGPIRPA